MMRRGMPVNRVVRLLRREPLSGDYFRLAFEHPEVATQGRAGQFVMIKAGVSAEPPLRRPFSLLGLEPERGAFTLLLKTVGPGTHALAAMQEGQPASCLGPLGSRFQPPPSGREPLLIAGGYGIAPFLLFSHDLRARDVVPRVFYGGRTGADLQLLDAFGALGVPLVAATEDGSLGARGYVTLPLEAYLDSHPSVALYACGPDALLRAVARIAARRGLPAQVSLDPWMGCGIGTCLGCVVRIQHAGDPRPRYKCACTEGPVFDAATVAWPGESGSLAGRGSAAP